ncbi:hypothetical protein ACOMHN_028010 [Nucella lapillus]
MVLFFRRAEANNQPPRPHGNPLPLEIASALAPVCKRLSDIPSFCGAVWLERLKVPTSLSVPWCGEPVQRSGGQVDAHSAGAVCVQRYNKGSSARLDVLAELSCGRQQCCKV